MKTETKKQITECLWANATKAHGSGSCGELGDSFMAIDSDCFSELADEILQIFEQKESFSDAVNHIKGLQHHKDTTVGLFAFDKDIEKVFENIPKKKDCKSVVEAHLVQQIEYLKSIVFTIS